MKREAFFLGLFSVGAQVLILREIVATLNGRELFIGIALFGWLVAVAIGAFWRGRDRDRFASQSLFLFGTILLPLILILIRLGPWLSGMNTGEIIPFGRALLFSVPALLPVGLISGALFPAITTKGHRPAASIAEVYLFEGLGAFAGGTAVTILIAQSVTGLPVALIIGIIIILAINLERFKLWLKMSLAFGLAAVVIVVIPSMERKIETMRYSPFRVLETFETPYGKETVIQKDENISLVTDNLIEATSPDWLTAEYLLLPPLLYNPDGKTMLYIGPGEFIFSELADSLPQLKITCLDPRERLEKSARELFKIPANVRFIQDDPVGFFSRREMISHFDFVVINIGQSENFLNNRLLTADFLSRAKLSLNEKGIIYLVTPYDSDRHISQEKAKILAVINNSIGTCFNHVAVWPGESTLFLASDEPLFNISLDSIMARTERFPYRPIYINDSYLSDRFQPLKIERLKNALGGPVKVNSVDNPVLVRNQAIFHSRADRTEELMTKIIIEKPYWAVGAIVILILVYIQLLLSRNRVRKYALVLYFLAGLVSLSLELVSFYLFQSTAGALYSDIGILIGAFMLGLAGGTYLALKTESENLEFPSLFFFIIATVLFYLTYGNIAPKVALYYHLLFLFTIALATGSLFVAATGKYYFGRSDANRGIGYGVEILGSSLGAILPLTVLIPLIGVNFLILSIVIILVLGLVGAFIAR